MGLIARLRWWWMWNSWRLDPRIQWMQLRAVLWLAALRLRCRLFGHLEQPFWQDNPDNEDMICARCGEYWPGGREWSETVVYFR